MQLTSHFYPQQSRKIYVKRKLEQISDEKNITQKRFEQDFQSDLNNYQTQKQLREKRNINDKLEVVENKEKHQGYEITVKITKENSFNEAYQDKLIQFIKNFYFNGHFQLSLYLPHTLGVSQKIELENEYKDLQFEIKEVEFEKSDYLFYQKIYQFKGQKNFDISPSLQMLILEQFKFKELALQADQSGYHLLCNFKKCEWSIPTPNNTLHDIKEQMKFFANNIQSTLDNYDIIAVETQGKQESLIIYKLVQQCQQKIQKELNTKIFPVLINLDKLKQDPEKYLDNEFISKIKQTLKYDQLYLVLEKSDLDLNLIYSDFKKFLNNKKNIYYENYEKQITFKESQDADNLKKECENVQNQFQNISIIVSHPKQIDSKYLGVNVQCQTWQEKNPTNFRQDCNKIFDKLSQIYNPYVQISMYEEQTFQIWQQYLKGQLDQSLMEHITEERLNQNDSRRNFIIKISTKFPKYEEELQKLKQTLENLQISTINIQNHYNQQLQKIIYENITNDEFEKILNNFQQKENNKIAQIKLLGIMEASLQFRVIYYRAYSQNEIEDVIKNKFIDDLDKYCINFPLISICDYLNLEIPKVIQEKDILYFIPKENKQQVILIGRRVDIQQFQVFIADIKNISFCNTMKIQLFIKFASLATEIIKKLKQQPFCLTNFDSKCLFTIEFYKKDFDKIYENLKDLEKSYETSMVQLLDVNEQKIIENIKEIEKKEQVIIDIQKLSIVDPLTTKGFLLDIGNNKQIKFIQGNISQIKCKAIVLEFVKNVDFSKVILQNENVKNILNLIEGERNKAQLLEFWRKQSQEQDIDDVNCLELPNHQNFKYLFQIYPKFYRQAMNLENNLSHINSLIEQVFQKSKGQNITQIAFPLIGIGLYGYKLKEIQSVLIQQIISQLSYQDCQILQVFVVIQNESEYRQIQEYCKSISNKTIINQAENHKYSFESSQIPCCYIDIGDDQIELEDSDVNYLINQKYQLLKEGEIIQPFTITYPFSKYPFTHSIDLKNNKMIQNKSKTQQTIQFIDLFNQRIYFIDQQQVSQSLNQYLLIKHELSKQNEFEIYYAQDEVKIINQQLYIKTSASDDFRKIIVKQNKKDKQNQNVKKFPITFSLSDQWGAQIDQNEFQSQMSLIEILSNNEQKIKNVMEQLKQLMKKRPPPQKNLKNPI